MPAPALGHDRGETVAVARLNAESSARAGTETELVLDTDKITVFALDGEAPPHASRLADRTDAAAGHGARGNRRRSARAPVRSRRAAAPGGADPRLDGRVEAVRRDDDQLHLGEHGSDVGDRGQCEPFTDLTGIDVKFSQLELTALVQKVALDFASGIGAYDVVYADPYQVLAPYSSAMASSTSSTTIRTSPRSRTSRTSSPRNSTPPVSSSTGQDLRAAVRRADADLDVPQGHLREAPGPDAGRPRVRPDAERRLDVGAVLRDLGLDPQEREGRRPVRVRPSRPSSTTR